LSNPPPVTSSAPLPDRPVSSAPPAPPPTNPEIPMPMPMSSTDPAAEAEETARYSAYMEQKRDYCAESEKRIKDMEAYVHVKGDELTTLQAELKQMWNKYMEECNHISNGTECEEEETIEFEAEPVPSSCGSSGGCCGGKSSSCGPKKKGCSIPKKRTRQVCADCEPEGNICVKKYSRDGKRIITRRPVPSS